MSTCISRHGEYSNHAMTDGMCDRCGWEYRISPYDRQVRERIALVFADVENGDEVTEAILDALKKGCPDA